MRYPTKSILMWRGRPPHEDGQWRLVYVRNDNSTIDIGNNCRHVSIGDVGEVALLSPDWVLLYRAKENE
jgi:hypothetical protein